MVLALELNVGLGCNNEAGENEFNSNPFSFHEAKVTSTAFLGEDVE